MNFENENNPINVTTPADQNPATVTNEETQTEVSGTETNLKRKKRLPRIPKRIEDVIRTAKRVLPHWQNSGLTLVWKTVSQFELDILGLDNTQGTKVISLGERKIVTDELAKLDRLIDSKLSYIKTYLSEVYGKQDVIAKYASCGFLFNYQSRYTFPKDRDKRLRSLETLLTGISRHGIQNRTFGLTYWQDIYTQYEDLLESADSHDGGNADRTQTKRVLLKEVRMTLRALYNLLKAQYPTSYKAIALAWGLQKQKY